MEEVARPTWVTAAATALFLVVVALLSRYWRAPKGLDIPILGIGEGKDSSLKWRYVQDAENLLQEGYKKFKNTAFQVMTPDGPRLILPRRYAQELIQYSRDEASNTEALSDRFLGEYTTFVIDSEIIHHVIKINLNRNLNKFFEDMQEEIVHCLDTQLSSCNSDDWTPINLFGVIQRTVAQASGRIFVGPRMCRSDEWIECNVPFAEVVMTAAFKLKLCPTWLRPLAQYLIPEMWRIFAFYRRGHRLLKPELDRRAAEVDGPVYHDMIEWMQMSAEHLGDESFDNKKLARFQMLMAMAAIHTSTNTVLHAIYDLLARPEYFEPLRAEMADVFRDASKPSQKQDLTRLRMLDSFLKESQRHNPPSVATFERKIMVPITLSDGLSLPAGTVVQCNTNIFEETPASWGDPYAFDGFRFSRLRKTQENANRLQFVSSTYDSMGFSWGKAACPGRFFASQMVKMVLIHLLTNYDFKFGEGVVGRPKNPMFEVTVLVDTTVKILAKKRVAA